MTKILIVNPNTTASMTETIGAAARAVAASGTEISAVTSSMGPVSIEGYYDEAFAVPGLIQALSNAPDADAAIIACFDDTGLDAARTAAPFPGRRHLRGGAGDGGADRKTHRRRHHAAALDRAAGRTGAPLWFCGKGAGYRLRRRGARSRKARLGRGGEAGSRNRARARQGRGGDRARLRRHGRSRAQAVAKIRRARGRWRGGGGEAGRGAGRPEAHDVAARFVCRAGREGLFGLLEPFAPKNFTPIAARRRSCRAAGACRSASGRGWTPCAACIPRPAGATE